MRLLKPRINYKLLVLATVWCSMWTLPPCQANNPSTKPVITAEVLYFQTHQLEPYLEVQFKIPSTSVVYQKTASQTYQAGLRVYLSTIAGNGDTLHAQQYILRSQEQATPDGIGNLIDLKPFPAPKVAAKLLLRVCDLANKQCGYYTTNLQGMASTNAQLSHIMLVDQYQAMEKSSAYTKNGLLLIPRLDARYREEEDFLTFYAEVYGRHSTVNAFLVGEDSQVVWKQQLQTTTVGKKQFALYSLPVSSLDGSYDLTLTINNEGELQFARKRIRVRNLANPTLFTEKYPYKTLKRYTQYLWPIAQGSAWDRLDSVINSNDTQALKQEFYLFWQSQMPDDPLLAWKNYLVLVRKANQLFSKPGTEGYLTDRGRVLLKYGQPSEITNYHDQPGTYPYEIWDYYNLSPRVRAKFIFADMAMGGKNFTLLHSDMPGEPQNPNWKRQIERGSNNSDWGRDD